MSDRLVRGGLATVCATLVLGVGHDIVTHRAPTRWGLVVGVCLQSVSSDRLRITPRRDRGGVVLGQLCSMATRVGVFSVVSTGMRTSSTPSL